jgi:RimJ/RimL family protein N-acetyltransferase
MSTVDQNIELRLAVPDDFAAITDIRQHPLVRPQQYRVHNALWLEILLARLNADVSAQSFEWRVTAIHQESSVIGHISEFRTTCKSGISVQLGWNLHPDYWGCGLMTLALTEFINQLFSNEICTSVIADCFSNNERCIRLLHRLGFVETNIGQLERLLICAFRLCPHRILRHKLDVVEWSTRHQPQNVG